MKLADYSTEKPEPTPNGSNGRDAKGRFQKGNKGGPGNPRGATVERLRQALLSAVTPKDIEQIAKRLIKDATEKGDVSAAKEILDRIFGKAKEAIEVSGPDGGPVEQSIKHGFDYARFVELYRQRTGRGEPGGGVSAADGRMQSVHPDLPDADSGPVSN